MPGAAVPPAVRPARRALARLRAAAARHPLALVLLLALLPRLHHVTFPVEGWHGWRQADTAAIARNFHDGGLDFFHPQVNHGGSGPRWVDTEFPLYPYAVALVWRLFGVHDGWGRLLSLLASLGTVFFLHRFARRWAGEAAALWAAGLYAILPLNVYYGRAFMPHALTLFCTMGGLELFSRWVDGGGRRAFAGSAALTALAALMNPTTLVIGLPLLYLARLRFGARWARTPALWLYAAAVLVPAAAWYAYSRAELYDPLYSVGIWEFGYGKWGNLDLLLSPKFYNDVFLKSVAERHLTWAGAVAFAVGLCQRPSRRGEAVLYWWLAAVVAYFLIVARGNTMHEYYQLPFVLPAAVFAGKAFARHLAPARAAAGGAAGPGPGRRLRPLLLVCLVAIPALGLARYLESFAAREKHGSPVARLAAEVAALTAADDLVVVVSEGSPLLLYRSHRKGWVVRPEDVHAAYLAARMVEGATHLAGLRGDLRTDAERAMMARVEGRFPPLLRSGDYFLVRLDPAVWEP